VASGDREFDGPLDLQADRTLRLDHDGAMDGSQPGLVVVWDQTGVAGRSLGKLRTRASTEAIRQPSGVFTTTL
jgi:hypothetical protein